MHVLMQAKQPGWWCISGEATDCKGKNNTRPQHLEVVLLYRIPTQKLSNGRTGKNVKKHQEKALESESCQENVLADLHRISDLPLPSGTVAYSFTWLPQWPSIIKVSIPFNFKFSHLKQFHRLHVFPKYHFERHDDVPHAF